MTENDRLTWDLLCSRFVEGSVGVGSILRLVYGRGGRQDCP